MSGVVISVDREGGDADTENQVVVSQVKSWPTQSEKSTSSGVPRTIASLVSHVNGDRWVRGRT